MAARSEPAVRAATTADQDEDEGDEGFDPADHTVDDVKAYVGEHPGERQAILDAETAGKNRVTLVDWLEEDE
jgi:hypothetical protein